MAYKFRSIGLFALVVLVLTGVPFVAMAAKVVPTIRIEIPSEKNESKLPETDLIPESAIENEAIFESPPANENDVEGAEPKEAPTPDGETTANQPTVTDIPIFYGEADLPSPVREMRRKLIKAARSGDPEKLRPIFDALQEPPVLSFDEEGDAIDQLRAISGDGAGLEAMAILLDILESGYTHREQGQDGEIFIWPYFVETPLDTLKPEQMIELFRIVTAGDFADMQSYGAYIFYRAGITPDGELKFFVTGD